MQYAEFTYWGVIETDWGRFFGESTVALVRIQAPLSTFLSSVGRKYATRGSRAT